MGRFPWAYAMDGFGHSLDPASARPTASLEALFRRHYRWLADLLRRRYGAETAEDLAQETWLKLARAGRVEDVRHPRALLAQVARNAAADHFRRARREAVASAPTAEAPLAPTQLEATLLKQIVLALPLKLRDVFLLNQVEGLTHPEIARRLGISVKTVEWRMRKALAQCATAMQD